MRAIIGVGAALFALAVLLVSPTPAEANEVTDVTAVTTVDDVPNFVRMTGLACNQCHVAPFRQPDFTWTGMKFRFNGWRAPWTADRIEAGPEGRLSGHRLQIQTYIPMNLHVRTILLNQEKPS